MMKILPGLTALVFLAVADLALGGSATWSLNPAGGDWNTAINWIPATVPNGASDVAAFAISNTTGVMITAATEVDEITFEPGASVFNLTTTAGTTLTISGAGVVNSSGVTQNFSIGAPISGAGGSLSFQNAATAGANVTYTAYGAPSNGSSGSYAEFFQNSTAGSATFIAEGATKGLDVGGGAFAFSDNSSAENASFTVNPAQNGGGFGGFVGFSGFATAGNAIFVINPGIGGPNHDAGAVGFSGNSTAGDGVFVLNGSSVAVGERTEIFFGDAATAGNGSFTVYGGQKPSAYGGEVYFSGYTFTGLTTTAGNATFINEGGIGAGSIGGLTQFSTASTAGQARIVANGGVDGGGPGFIFFSFEGDGGQAQIEVYDDGYLDLSYRDAPGITIGSLAGDGFVYLGSRNLTIGNNDQSTSFAGIIQEDGGIVDGSNGSITKIGAGALTMSGASTYAGGTTVNAGTLRVKNTTGSATGTGGVLVAGGTLGGPGFITGAVTIGTGGGTGATLQPGKGASIPTTTTIQNTLTFKTDGVYSYKLNSKKAKADRVIATGVTIATGAEFNLSTVGTKKLTTGMVFTAINNTAGTPINGTFGNLPDGSTLTSGSNTFQASYTGGDGNDLTLTVSP